MATLYSPLLSLISFGRQDRSFHLSSPTPLSSGYSVLLNNLVDLSFLALEVVPFIEASNGHLTYLMLSRKRQFSETFAETST
jgi:hypothetical protein